VVIWDKSSGRVSEGIRDISRLWNAEPPIVVVKGRAGGGNVVDVRSEQEGAREGSGRYDGRAIGKDERSVGGSKMLCCSCSVQD
jgi:hypothetical protein